MQNIVIFLKLSYKCRTKIKVVGTIAVEGLLRIDENCKDV